ncbi:MAG: hypothetical protein GY873_30170 [Bosea sp.]|uniref:hypothetical protein n=1 Tax=Bosea sp. (in: a-proteobacteria) TaxID=1871050 RepID=UPI00238757B3|nr:hypothetical protein [Bosea sp. (in: a-proteobacteria)]MCP4738462.1 hypothetical protein [Bosea sp. (in: a-proteobacteria)]
MEAARDRILRGDQATSVMVAPNLHRVEFAPPNLARLDDRIDELKAKEEGRPRRGAIGFAF